jgi:hypothetical protein
MLALIPSLTLRARGALWGRLRNPRLKPWASFDQVSFEAHAFNRGLANFRTLSNDSGTRDALGTMDTFGTIGWLRRLPAPISRFGHEGLATGIARGSERFD